MNKKTLLIGGSSFIGRSFLNKYNSSNIISTYCKNKVSSNAIKFDSLNMRLEDVIKKTDNFENAVLLLGDTRPDSCYRNPEFSNKLNVDSIIKILELLKKWKIKPYFFSSEFVYDGEKGGYKEEDSANPAILYGNQKILIEEYITSNFDDYIIFRLSKTCGRNLNDGTIFSNWLNSAINNKTIYCAIDQKFSPVFIGDVIKVVYNFLDTNNSGIYNLSGKYSYTRKELLDMFITQYNELRKGKIKTKTFLAKDSNFGEIWPIDVSMDAEKIRNVIDMDWMTPDLVCSNLIKKYVSE